MTNKDAIQWIKGIVKLFFGRGYYDTQRREALNLAIKALRIVEVIENGFKRDNKLIMDADDWEDIKALADDIKALSDREIKK